jgi:catecholate siderophore receptor
LTRERAHRKQSRKRTRSVWMAAGTLVACSAVRPAAYADALAAPRIDASAAGAGPAAALPVRRFDIPAGPLGSVLEAYRAASGVRVRVPDPAVLQIPSGGVTGVLPVEAALRQILAGTSLGFRFTSSETADLTFDAQESLEVTGTAPINVSPKFTEPLRDTPQTISVVPAETMEEQATSTLRDALRNVAGLSIAAGEGGAQGDNLTLRGFTARNDIYIDGMRDFGSYYRDPFDLQQVEVLKGPSSSEFGRGSTGGVVNQTSKQPSLQRYAGADLFLGNAQNYRVTADVSEPIPGVAKGAAFQIAVMGNDGHVAGRDVAESRRWGVAPSIGFGLDGPTRLTLAYFHLTAKDIPDYGVPWYFDQPAPVARSNYYGFEDGSFLDTTADMGTLRFEHDFSGTLSVRDQARYARYTRDARITEARLPASVTPETPLDRIDVTRNQIAVDSTETFLQNQLDATVHFETGVLEHTLVSGIEFGRETSDPTRFTWTGVPSTSLLRPDPADAFAGSAAATSRVETTSDTFAAYALDTVSIGRFQVTGGFRWDRFSTDYAQFAAPALALSRVDSMPNWRAAIVYKPRPEGTIYFDAGTSSNPSAETLSLSSANVNLDPEKNRTYEVGTKWELAHGRISASLALFRTEKLNAREPDPNDPAVNVLAGKQRVDGVEVELAGRLTDGWRANLSYAFLDARLVESQYYPQAVGARLANVPENTFRIWNVFALPWSVDLGAGANYVGSRTASATVPNDPVTGLPKQAPGYWTFDAMIRRPLTATVDLQLNLTNLGNTTYYDQLHPAHIVPGAGRTAVAGVSARF